MISSILFVIPFFFIVGFDKDGVAEKFFWYWLFQALYMSVMVFLGHLLAYALPGEGAAGVVGGMSSTCISLFAGYMIREEKFPKFWLFLYWLDPLHYTLEGLIMTQFNNDHTEITTTSGQTMTAETYINNFFSTWSYEHRFGDFSALILFIIVLRIAAYLSMEYLRHDKR